MAWKNLSEAVEVAAVGPITIIVTALADHTWHGKVSIRGAIPDRVLWEEWKLGSAAKAKTAAVKGACVFLKETLRDLKKL